MRIFLSSNYPVSEHALTAICRGLVIQPTKYSIFSPFRVFLDFDTVEDALNAVDGLNNYFHCQKDAKFDIKALPALPTSIVILQTIQILNCQLTSLEAHYMFCHLRGFAAVYVIKNVGYILFNSSLAAEKALDSIKLYLFNTYEIACYLEQDVRRHQIKVFTSIEAAKRLLSQFSAVFISKFQSTIVYFMESDCIHQAIVILQRESIQFTTMIYHQQNRACQIYNLRISLDETEIMQKLQQVGNVDKISFPPFTFVDTAKYHINVLFKDVQSRNNCEQWFSLIGEELAQDGKQIIIV
ncbi:hypothetical protein SS50377_23176 [Spironucleus salmonicida]|uniref:Uncharacterized protein n=1 Tax=Spironucleus salmonicida TaxID=348837 RepID=V6LBP9_9EUKA|nr:hypothetical protein SS50377_23176 [Spironucleus salmonicida]|eukprot:EST41648.1 hypothetical protein SS50377_18734 [Spironucleus salmonicida]